MEMENVVAEAIFDFNPSDSIELTLKVRAVVVKGGAKRFSVLFKCRAQRANDCMVYV